MSKPVETFMSLFEPNRAYTWKQALNGAKTMLPRMQFSASFRHLELRREIKDASMEVGGGKVGIGLQDG